MSEKFKVGDRLRRGIHASITYKVVDGPSSSGEWKVLSEELGSVYYVLAAILFYKGE